MLLKPNQWTMHHLSHQSKIHQSDEKFLNLFPLKKFHSCQQTLLPKQIGTEERLNVDGKSKSKL